MLHAPLQESHDGDSGGNAEGSELSSTASGDSLGASGGGRDGNSLNASGSRRDRDRA